MDFGFWVFGFRVFELGKGFAVFGNVLTSSRTVECMAKTYNDAKGTEFSDRLLLAPESELQQDQGPRNIPPNRKKYVKL